MCIVVSSECTYKANYDFGHKVAQGQLSTVPFQNKNLAKVRVRNQCKRSVAKRKDAGVIGASLSEPHIDEFAVNFPYIYFFIYLFLYIYRTSCRKSLPARILRVIASCVNSNHKPFNVRND